MPHRPTLAEFVDQELRLSETALAAIADGVLKQWRDRAPLGANGAIDALRVLHGQRSDFITHALQSLREQTTGRRDTPRARPGSSGRLELSLVDDDEVTADIEIARIVERGNAELEEPLRELRTYTSALVGDVNSARDTNPLRPEVWVRAVHAAARTLPIARNLQTDLLRCAARPLIQALRDSYAAACSRLHALGVVPALHRTVVNEGVVTELTDATRARRSLERDHERDVAADGTWIEVGNVTPPHRHPGHAAGSGGLRSGAAPAAAAGGAQAHAQQLTELYEAMLADRRLPLDCRPLLARLYPAVLRQALLDASLLDDAAHAVWRLIDHLAFLVQTREVGNREANIEFARNLVEQLVAQPNADARAFQSAVNRLVVLERQRFARAVAAAATDIATLGAQAQRAVDGPTPTLPQTLDAGSVDSQPAPLRRDGDAEPEPDDIVGAWRAGSWLTIFLRGRWRRALVLWRAPSPGPLLLLDADEARHWALRGAAIERLAAAGIARVFSPRSLISDASGRVGSHEPGSSLFG